MSNPKDLRLSPATETLLSGLAALQEEAVANGSWHEYHFADPIRAFVTRTQSVMALPPCTIIPPPAAITIAISPSTRNLHLECGHTPQHCWELSGASCGC